ncbi:hypothetical protein [Paremcibacter congregatus]|uniref:hypothetical protein n=1 Tax=Paremcibacter congregatus TaxID=2043170 RepID=UPI0013FDDF1B|nr:hypothetical protein [Paremcibacter congregatus]
MPLLLVGGIASLLGFGGGWFAADGTKSLIRVVMVGGVAYWLLATPSGKSMLKKVTG